MHDVWTEKYRPRKLSDVVGQEDITERLKSYVKTHNMPHLLFAGSAGTGKTTSAIALAREMFGEDWHANFKELNASDERGIDVVRGKIKEFSRTVSLGGAEFKIIFLDEADALTSAAQAALRRTMEQYSRNCRFVLSCNYSSKIIAPIQSRCALFRFRNLKREDLLKYLKTIAEKEGLDVTDEGFEALVYIAEGDLRKGTNSLQIAASLGEKIDANSLYKTAALARPKEIKNLLETAIGEADFLKTRMILERMLIEYGLSGEDVLKQIHKGVFDLSIPDRLKVKLVEKIGEAEFRLVEGSNAAIQLEALLAYFVLVGEELKD